MPVWLKFGPSASHPAAMDLDDCACGQSQRADEMSVSVGGESESRTGGTQSSAFTQDRLLLRGYYNYIIWIMYHLYSIDWVNF